MIGCLCIHGFTGSPSEVAPLVAYLEKRTNWRIVAPTLPGHGHSLNLKGIHYDDWLTCAESEISILLQQCDEVYVIGFSMGGMIASHLASTYPVTKLVLLSAAAHYLNPRQLTQDLKEMLTNSFRGKAKLSDQELFVRYRQKIKATPLRATWEFTRLVKQVRPKLEKVCVPTFIAQGELDGIVPPKSAEFLYSRIQSKHKQLYYCEQAKHLICHSPEREQLFGKIYQFLTS